MTADETTANPLTEHVAVFPDNVPVLVGDGIVLRAHRISDAQRIVEQSSDAESQRFIPLPENYDMDAALGYLSGFAEKGWNEGTRFEFAIEDVSGVEPLFCGNMGVWPKEHDRWEIGWVVHPQARGRGIATRAAARILEWVFEEKGGVVVMWRAVAENAGSTAVARKLGFPEPAVLEKWLPHKGELFDCAISTLTRQRFDAVRG